MPAAWSSLLCTIGRIRCAIPLEHVVETSRPLPVEPLAGAPDVVRGVALLRGEPLPVVDAGRLLGVTSEGAEGARFVVLRVGARRAVLAVDGVTGVRGLRGARTEPLAELLGGARQALAAIGVQGQELLVVIDALRVVPEEAWAALAENVRR
ncbi:MAG: chemotaxis protein CheW [Labilithrix sp.]|nr:chemotaxis protein CheW [Labilithrix sp.]